MRQYETLELVLKGPEPETSPALVKPEAEFTVDGSNKKMKVQGFYAGKGVYKVRFYPQEEGLYSWKVNAQVKDGNKSLTLKGPLTGMELCVKAEKDFKGMVRAKGVHFVYENGERYLAVGTTVYAMMHQERKLIDQTFETLAKAPFNKVRFCMFPKHYDYNHNEPDCFAYEKTGDKFDVNRPFYPFWDEFERRILQLEELGIQGDLILFHPYDRWGFSQFSREECLIYLDYMLRRLSAFPNLWWSMANEYDLMEHFERKWWYDFSQFIFDHDPYGHLLSNHNCLPFWDFSDVNTTHCCIQDFCVNRVPSFQTMYGKPVVFDECCYEGNIEHAWGNLSAFEMVNRFWTAFVLGGYCTHGETYLDDREILWWAKGGTLHGESPARIAYLREFMESLPGDPESVCGYWASRDIEDLRARSADPARAKELNAFERGIAELPEERIYRFADSQDAVESHCKEKVFMRYYGRQCTAKGSFDLPKKGYYEIQVIDVWEMTCETVLTGVNGKVDFSLPGKEGILAVARKL